MDKEAVIRKRKRPCSLAQVRCFAFVSFGIGSYHTQMLCHHLLVYSRILAGDYAKEEASGLRTQCVNFNSLLSSYADLPSVTSLARPFLKTFVPAAECTNTKRKGSIDPTHAFAIRTYSSPFTSVSANLPPAALAPYRSSPSSVYFPLCHIDQVRR